MQRLSNSIWDINLNKFARMALLAGASQSFQQKQKDFKKNDSDEEEYDDDSDLEDDEDDNIEIIVMATAGNVQNTAQKMEFEWRMKDFFELPLEDGKYRHSPLFSFAGESWYLEMYPNGRSINNSNGFVSLYLHRNESGPPISLTATLALRTFDGKKDQERQFTYVFEKAGGYGYHKCFTRSRLLEKKLQLVPSDCLTILCSMESFFKTTSDTGKNETVVCSVCKGSFVPSPDQKSSNIPVKCSTCADAAVIKKCLNHQCEKVREKATEKLVDDLGNIFCNEELSDVTIKIKDEEFRLHRCILAGRNPYFNSMFTTEMKEKAIGIVTIDDCEPEAFRSFIHFVYTGKLDDLSLENVCDLYKVADKYQADQLKEECLCFMNNEMSVQTFCDFIILALKYGEKELLQNATELFCRKVKEIIKSVKWQTFMREYPTEANELHIKALDYIMPSK